MNAVIQSPTETIEHGLHIKPATPRSKTFKDRAVDVCLPITIGILEVKNLRGHSHEDTPIISNYRGGPGKALGEDAAFFKLPITISIFQ